MTDLWNIKILEQPPINSVKADIKEIDIKLLRKVLKDAVDFFENQPHLYTEAALLSRIIYRVKMKFRSSKDLQAMEKLNRALRAYLEVGISNVLNSFLDSVPQVYKANSTYLPTKHMIDFVLVRMQGLGKILVRVLEMCKTVCQVAQQRLRLGHCWNIAIIVYGVAARIFVIVKNAIKYTCELYGNLVPFSSKLGSIGKPWLPDGYVLPESLSEWLDIDWMDLETTIIEIADEEPEINFFNLIEDSDDDVEFCDEYVLIRDETLQHRDTSEEEETVEISDTDVGEVISLSDVESIRNGALSGFNNVDIGEVIDASDCNSTPKPQTTESKKRKRRKRLSNMNSNEIINLSNIETPLKTTQRKKPFLNVIEIDDTPQVKSSSQKEQQTTPKSARRKKPFVNVIEIDETPQVKSSCKKKQQTPAKSAQRKKSFINVIEIDETPQVKSVSQKKKKTSFHSFNVEIKLSGVDMDNKVPKKGKKRKHSKSSPNEDGFSTPKNKKKNLNAMDSNNSVKKKKKVETSCKVTRQAKIRRLSEKKKNTYKKNISVKTNNAKRKSLNNSRIGKSKAHKIKRLFKKKKKQQQKRVSGGF